MSYQRIRDVRDLGIREAVGLPGCLPKVVASVQLCEKYLEPKSTHSCNKGAQRTSRPPRSDQRCHICSRHGVKGKTLRLICASVVFHRQHDM
jgi:hypothetical protein